MRERECELCVVGCCVEGVWCGVCGSGGVLCGVVVRKGVWWGVVWKGSGVVFVAAVVCCMERRVVWCGWFCVMVVALWCVGCAVWKGVLCGGGVVVV